MCCLLLSADIHTPGTKLFLLLTRVNLHQPATARASTTRYADPCTIAQWNCAQDDACWSCLKNVYNLTARMMPRESLYSLDTFAAEDSPLKRTALQSPQCRNSTAMLYQIAGPQSCRCVN